MVLRPVPPRPASQHLCRGRDPSGPVHICGQSTTFFCFRTCRGAPAPSVRRGRLPRAWRRWHLAASIPRPFLRARDDPVARPVAAECVAQHRVYGAPDLLCPLSIGTLGSFSCGCLQHEGRPCIRPSGSKSLASFQAREPRPRGLSWACRGRARFPLSTRNRQFLGMFPADDLGKVGFSKRREELNSLSTLFLPAKGKFIPFNRRPCTEPSYHPLSRGEG